MRYQAERYEDVIDELMPIIEAHYEEVTTFKEVKKLELCHVNYAALCRMGLLVIWTVRNDDDKLVGYSSWFINQHMHYASCRMAASDALYVAPEYRGRTVSYRLFKHALADLKEKGVQIATFHMKLKFPFRRLMEKLGGVAVEENWEIKL